MSGRRAPSHATALLLVFLGGAAGSALRAAVALALPGRPLGATLAVNVVGALALGLLLESVAGRGSDRVRLLLGVGLCGGFTTYSAVAVQAAELLRGGEVVTAALYALVTLVAGALAVLVGIVLGARIRGRGDGAGAAGRPSSAPRPPGAEGPR